MKIIYDKLITYIIDASSMFKTTGRTYNWNRDVDFDTITLRGNVESEYLKHKLIRRDSKWN